MEETADIYYVDTRNADHRHPAHVGGSPFRPRTAYQPNDPRPMTYPPQQPQIIYAQPPQANFVSSIFGKLSAGQVVEMVATLFAAFQPLPTAPIATKDASTDVQNGLLYQSALAQHAKRDEQFRTIGGLVAKLVG